MTREQMIRLADFLVEDIMAMTDQEILLEETPPLDLEVLRDLADRCKAATGPDREIDARIWAEFDGRDVEERPAIIRGAYLEARSRVAPHDACMIVDREDDGQILPVTSSSDAAMALVERRFPEAYYVLGKGVIGPDEPPFAFQLMEPISERRMVVAEHNNRELAIVLCVILAEIEQLGKVRE